MKHAAVVFGLLLATAICHLAVTRAQDSAARVAPAQDALDIPASIGEFTQAGPDMDPGDHVRELLQTNTILIRDYRSAKGWPVQLTIVHAGTTRGSLHFPEVCLVGQGWEVQQQYLAPVGISFTAKRLLLVKGDATEAVLYWFKTGDSFTGDFFLNSWYWVKGKLSFQAPKTSMIRVSTGIGREGEETAFRVLEDFAVQLAPVLQERLE